MRIRRLRENGRRLRGLALGAALALAAVVAGAALPRLPGDRALPQSGDSPGVVTFSHAAHVDQKHPDCTLCHPGRFPIVAGSKAPRERLTHAQMEAGQKCGACHNGRDAHGFDDCASCHRER